MLERIDKDLRAEGIPIPFRPIHAIGRAATILRQWINHSDPLAKDIDDWYSSIYGERLQGTTLLGRIPVVLRGEIYSLAMKPKVYIDSDGVPKPGYDWTLEAGPALFETLTPAESALVYELIQMGWVVFSELAPHVAERELPMEATAELQVSLDWLLRNESAVLGLSKWASLQVAEKVLKYFLRSCNERPPFTHKISVLHDLAVQHGFPDLREYSLPEGNVLEVIECSAAVRYGEVSVSVKETVGAHYSALTIAMAAAIRMRLNAGRRNWLELDGDSPGLFMIRRMCEIGKMFPIGSTKVCLSELKIANPNIYAPLSEVARCASSEAERRSALASACRGVRRMRFAQEFAFDGSWLDIYVFDADL